MEDDRLPAHRDDEIGEDEGRLHSPRVLSLEDVFGSVPALPDRETGDFDDLIEEAMEAHADWVVDRMRRGEE